MGSGIYSLVSFLCVWLSNFPSTIYWREFPLSIVWFWLPYWKLFAHIHVVLLLGSQFCSIGLCVFFLLIPCCFDYCHFVVYFEVRECDTSSFVLFSQDCCGYFGSFVISYKSDEGFFCSISLQNCDFYGDCIKSVYYLG